MAIRSHRDLDVWKDAMRLVELAYRFTDSLPTREQFGLCQQMRRAAVSIPSNIAEGHSRHTRPAYVHHLRIALGSQAEFETQLELTVRLGLTSATAAKDCEQQTALVGRRLHALVQSLERSDS
ncbi:MAG: four helix bundle protein [Acidobacteria bacterium]|nr:four helix bundle protein [Acidobacteriota bacterium]